MEMYDAKSNIPVYTTIFTDIVSLHRTILLPKDRNTYTVTPRKLAPKLNLTIGQVLA
jgi:hypothetical protein